MHPQGKAFMKSVLAALGLIVLLPASAIAGCADDLKTLDAAIAGQEKIEPDVKTQVQDMRAQAEKLCTAGNEDEAEDVISEATAMLTTPQ